MKMDKGTWPPFSTTPWSLATLSLYFSVSEATTMMMMCRAVPIPILWRRFIPLGFLVHFLTRGTKSLSYIATETRSDMVTKPARLAGGMLKLPTFLFRVVPCFTKSVLIWAIIVLGMNVATKIGSIFSICLVSSISVTVHSIHGLVEPVFTPALSINLHIYSSFMVSRDWYTPLPKDSNYDPSHSCKWASTGLLVPIVRRTCQKYEYGYRQARSWEPISKGPAHIVLDVHQNSVGKECAKKYAEHPPVEE
nr:hypothetical protein TSUD_133750 [Ipomoea batatas]